MNNIEALNKKALNAPMQPGVYLMKNDAGEIIYVGKAKLLKNRLGQYFKNIQSHTPKVLAMVESVSDFDYIICQSEYEALMLECSLIKQNQPKYNILLKDDKGYHYIKVTKEFWPRIYSVKQLENNDDQFLGPYYSGVYVKTAVEDACRYFKLPQCKKHLGDDKYSGKRRPCLNYSIGLCCAPCAGKITNSDYLELVESAVNFLKKGKDSIIDDLTEKMNNCAENLEYEKAAFYRDRIVSLKNVNNKQKVVNYKIENQDVFAICHSTDKTCVEVFSFRDKKLVDDNHFFINGIDTEAAQLSEFLREYYTRYDDIPKLILLDREIEDQTEMSQWLSEKTSKAVKILVPQRGEAFELVNMCKTNARERISVSDGYRNNPVLEELADLIGLNKIPKIIESYDISHTAGKEAVAGMVVFKNGKPYKKGYRKFVIKEALGGDDYSSLTEVITRRIGEYNNGSADETFSTKPDLMLIDGGQGQLNVVKSVVDKLGFEVPVFGMVKNEHHKTNNIVGLYGEIEIKRLRSVFTLISNIQDEVHRYSVTFHHNRKKNAQISMELTKIEGIGKQRAKNLLEYFGSLDDISKASVEELSSIKGISDNLAREIHIALSKKS